MALVVDGGGLVNKGGALGTGAACCCGGGGGCIQCEEGFEVTIGGVPVLPMPFAGPSSGGDNCRTCEGYVTDQPDGASVGCEENLDDTYIIGEDVVGYTLPSGCELAGAPESPAQLRAAWCTYCGDDNKTHLVIHVQIWLNLSEENFFLKMMQNLEYVLEGVGEANLTQEHDITNQGGGRGLEDVDGDGAADFATGQLQDRHGFDCNTGLFPAPNSIWTYRDGGDAEWSNMGVDVACDNPLP